MTIYVAKFKDSEIALDDSNITLNRINTLSDSLEDLARTAVYKSGEKTPRKDPKSVDVQIVKYFVKDKKLITMVCRIIKIPLPLERMKSDEFNEAMDALLEEISDPKVCNLIRSQSYEMGHSSAYEEVLNIASDMISKYLN